MRPVGPVLVLVALLLTPGVTGATIVPIGTAQWIVLKVHAVGQVSTGMLVNAMNGSAVWVAAYEGSDTSSGSASAIGGVSTFRVVASAAGDPVDRNLTTTSPLFQGGGLTLPGGHDYEVLMIGGGRNVTDSFYQFTDIDHAGSTWTEAARGPQVFYGTLEDDYGGGALISAGGEGARARVAALREDEISTGHTLMGRVGFAEHGASEAMSTISSGAWSATCPCMFDSITGAGTAGPGDYQISWTGIEATPAGTPDHLLADVSWPV